MTVPNSPSYQVTIIDRQRHKEYKIRATSDRYILQTAENQGADLPFACRQGACTSCAVRIKSGTLTQPDAMGLSPGLRKKGYALLCVSYAQSDLVVETQDEDEVYEQQFGRYFAKGKVKYALPLDED
jgi:ferredoxin